MVNPGHPSRGCQRCRNKKIKCDQESPCAACKKHQQECIYPDNVFRSMNDSSAEKVRKRAGTRRLNCTSSTLPTRQKSLTKNRPHHETSSSPPICKSPSQYDDHYFITVLSKTLFPTILTSDYKDRTWPGYLALGAGQHSLAYNCLQSLSRACTGQVTRKPELVLTAQSSYTSCLRHLHAQLEDPKTRCDESILLPVSIFGAYETLFMTSGDGWIRHTLGLAALFDLRGSGAFSPGGHAIQIFRNSRQVMVLAALSARQPSFLTREEWRTQPWIASQTPKDSFERLLDIVVMIPELNVRSLALNKGEVRADIHQDSLDLLCELMEWRADWESSSDGVELRLYLPPHLDTDYPYSYLDPPIDYLSKYAATVDALYQGAKIFILNIAISTLPAGMDGAAGLVFMVNDTALQICRTLPYFMTSKYSLRSKLDVLWSLHLAWQVLRGPADSVWVKERTPDIASESEGISDATLSTTPGPVLRWLSGIIDEWAVEFGNLLISPGNLANMIKNS